MSAHRERPPLWIQPGFSPRLAAFVVLTHALAGIALLILAGEPRAPALAPDAPAAFPGAWLEPGLALAVAASLAWRLWSNVLGRAPTSLRLAIWNPDGSWRLVLNDGRIRAARLSPATFVSPALVVLNFSSGRGRHRAMPLFADALEPDVLRRLRQRLRAEGTAPPTR